MIHKPLPSVKKTLIVSVLTVTLSLSVISSLLTYFDARHEVSELFDAQLAESAKILLAEASHELHELSSVAELEDTGGHFQHRYSQKILFQIRNKEGRQLMRSGAELADESFSSLAEGFETRQIKDEIFRIFVLWDQPHQLQIQVAQYLKSRENFATDIALHVVLPLLFGFPILTLLIFWSVNRGFAPILRLAQEVSNKSSSELMPLSLTQESIETKPLVDSIHSLIERLKVELAKEKRFVEHASHEMKTPLAALRIHAEVARAAEAPDERVHALEQIIKTVDRVTHLVTQLLTLSKIDHDHSATGQKASFSLTDLVRECIIDLSPLAIAKSIEISLSEEEVQLSANRLMLYTLVKNLIDNAIRYTPVLGVVRVSVLQSEGKATLVVNDSGAGVPASEISKISDRFYRIAGTQPEGSGLGLAIVHEIAKQHGASIEFRNVKGFEVRVTF